MKYGVNLAIHTFHSEMWNAIEKEGKLHPKMNHQIDGRSENTMYEVLVARGLTTKIVISRLPVGHTHEDIDATFAKL